MLVNLKVNELVKGDILSMILWKPCERNSEQFHYVIRMDRRKDSVVNVHGL